MSLPGRSTGGFTLVEVLVALAAMALMSVMAWRGVDAMARAQAQTRQYSEEVLTLQTGLAQWGRDLDAAIQLTPVGGMDFDGRVLRVTRLYAPQTVGGGESATPVTDGGSVRVVAWGARLQDGQRQFLRWQSGPLYSRSELRQAWDDAATWGQNPTDALRRYEVQVATIDAWQIYYFRNTSWSSPLSSAGGTGVGQNALPDGVRLLLTLSSGHSISGKLSLDWVKPTVATGLR